jgi:MFS family permease
MDSSFPPTDRAGLHRARLAVMFFFLLDGTVLGSWFARIPDVQRALDLDHGQLGIALLGSAAGALVMQPVAGWWALRWGSRRVVTIGAFAQCTALLLPAIAPGLPSLVVALVVLGGATGIIDVAMNVHAVEVERRYGRPIMSSFHALYSMGGLLGAVAAGVVAGLEIAPLRHFIGMAAGGALMALAARRHLLSTSGEVGSAAPAFARPPRHLLRLCGIAFCVVLAEGAVGDWSSVYLRQELAVTTGMVAGGYAAFSLMMTVGRLAGGRVVTALGEVAVVRVGGALTAAGMGAAVISSHPVMAMAGFACVGLGLACSFPITISAAGRVPGVRAGTAIAAVNTAGYTGFLAGPPLIGFVAELTGLRPGLGMLVLIGVVMIAFGATVSPATAGSRAHQGRELAAA